MEKMTGSMAGKDSMVGKMPGNGNVVNGLFVCLDSPDFAAKSQRVSLVPLLTLTGFRHDP